MDKSVPVKSQCSEHDQRHIVSGDEDLVNPVSPSGCCVDCGSGRTTCDDGCIRKLAAIQCRASCGAQPEQSLVKPLDGRVDGCCSLVQANLPDDQEAEKVNQCCTDKTAGCSDTAAPNPDRGSNRTGSHAQTEVYDSCCADREIRGDCIDKKDVSCAEKINDCCAAQVDHSPTEEGKSCCAVKKFDSSSTAKQNDCIAKETNCCTEKPNNPAPKSSDSYCRETGVDGYPSEQKQTCGPGKPKACCPTEPADSVITDIGDNCCANDGPHSIRSICSTQKTPTVSLSGRKRPRTATEACVDHLQQAFDQYSSYLEKGRCICRSVLDRLDTCCGQPIPKKQPKDGASGSLGDSSAIEAHQQTALRRKVTRSCEKACCDQETLSLNDSKIEKSSSCALDDLDITRAITSKAPLSTNQELDLEGAAARQHVVLRVSGMTCTGCSRKIASVLDNIDGISSITVTFVTGIAEFDLNPGMMNLQQVIPRVEKETGFKFAHIDSDHQVLDVKVASSIADYLSKQSQATVESIEKVSRSTYRITYDPTIVGARALLSSIEGASLAPPMRDTTITDGRRRLFQLASNTAITAMLTIPIVVLAWSDNPIPHSTRSIVSLVLATFVQAFAVPEFYVGAIKSLIYSRVIEMDMLVVISITAAYGYSVVAFSLIQAGYALETKDFFETSSLLITLVLLGRLVAAVAKVKAISQVSTRSLQAGKALLVGTAGLTTEIDARLLQFGDVFVVPAHGRVTTDGVVIHGQSSLDESMVTGESLPVSKAVGDTVIAGTVNGPTALTVRLTRLPGRNSITDIAKLVENALAAKPRVQDLADKLAGYFTPVVLVISLVVFGVWVGVALALRGKSGGASVGTAITYSIAVLAISCPCALGLAVPMVLVIAGGVAARNGVIIKQADAIERGFKVTDVVLDKTGTITKDDLHVVHGQIFPIPKASENTIASLIKSLTQNNQHPVSLAVAAHVQGRPCDLINLENVESIPGAGIQCTWKSSTIKAGNPYWLRIEDRPEITTLINQGMTLFCLTLDANLIAIFGLKSNIRDEAIAVIADLHHRNITCHIVSGDNPIVVNDVARTVNIPASNTASRQSPAQKQLYVQNLMSSGRTVLFCGDGTNDAVAVAQANIGVQIGSTSDVTRATADVVLLGGLDGLTVLLDLSKRSFHRIVFNFVWAAVYNVFAILLAAGAFVHVRVPPAYAGLGEMVSVAPVIVAALTLLRGGGS